LVRSIPISLIWRFLRRSFAGAVLIYVFVCGFMGERSSARPIFYFSVGIWIFFQILWIRIERRSVVQSDSAKRMNPGPGRNGRIFGRAGHHLELVAFNLALTLFLAEFGLRLYGAWSGRSLLIADTIDAYKLVPGHDYGGGLRGNNFGYPGWDFVIDKRPGIRRLAVLGDSFAVGPAVPFADNFLNLLESRFPNVEVYNFGISSTGPREYQAVLQADVWRFQPDMVLVCVFVGNDITESLATPRGMSIRNHALFLFLSRAGRLIHERTSQAILSIPSSPDPFPRPSLSEEAFREVEARRLSVCQCPSPPGMEKKWQQALYHLDQIITDCKNRKVPVGFILIPDEFQVSSSVFETALKDANLSRDYVDLDLPQRRLRVFCADRSIPCLDLLPSFDRVRDTYASRDTHWNVRGNHLAAEKIMEWLAEDFDHQ